MLPEPDAVQVPPPAPTQVHVQVREAGKVSATVLPDASLGPALEAVIVYVTEPPGVAVVTPSVLVTARSALAANVSVSVAELLPGVGSVTPPGAATVDVLLRLPVAAAVQVPPPAPTQVHVQVNEAGKVSATEEPGALLGPALEAVIVYVTEPPGVAVVTPSVLVTARSALAANVSVSVAELLPGVGSVTPPGAATVDVLLRLPVAEAEIVQLAV